MDIISQMRNSNDRLLKSEADDLSRWSKLRHTKADLEFFLTYNIAEIKFRTKDNSETRIICSSNDTLVNVIKELKLENKKKIIDVKPQGFKTKAQDSVLTWDLVDRKFKSINLSSWVILNFISIDKDNILILDEVIKKILKK